jgi:Tfp pilus assembly protein PilO
MKSFIPFILIAICIATYYMYISPLYSQVQALSSKKAEYVSALQKAREVNQKKEELLTAYNAISPEDLDRLNKIIPDHISNVEIANSLNSLASSHGMTIKALQILTPKSNSSEEGSKMPYKTWNISFSVTGKYDQFIGFLKDIESNIDLTDVVSLTIRAPKANPTTMMAKSTLPADLFEYTVEMHSYSLN